MKSHEKRHLLNQIRAGKAGGVFVRLTTCTSTSAPAKTVPVSGKKVTRPNKPSAKRDAKTLELLRLSSEPLEPSAAGRPLVMKNGKAYLYSPTFSTFINPTPSNDHSPAPWKLVTDRLRLIYLNRQGWIEEKANGDQVIYDRDGRRIGTVERR